MSKYRLVVCALLCALGMAMANAPARASLVVYFPFEEGPGATSTFDSAGARTGNFNGDLDGTSWVTSGLAPVPTGTTAALMFDQAGADDYVDFANLTNPTGTTPRSVSAWIKTTDNNGVIVSWGDNVAGQKYTFRVQDTNGTAGAIRTEVNGGYRVGSTVVNDGQWHHVAVVWDFDGSANVNDSNLFVDGRRESNSATLAQGMNTSSGDDFRVGLDRGTANPYTGLIDEVRVYDHALSAGELVALAGNSNAVLTYDAALDTDADSEWEDLVGVLNAGGQMDLALSSPTRVAINASTQGLPFAYRYGGSDTSLQNGNIQSNSFGDVTDESVSFEMWLRPRDLSGNEVLMEFGGGTDGTSLTLSDNMLQFAAIDDGSIGAGVSFDLTSAFARGDILQVVGVIDLQGGLISLFVDGQLVGTDAFAGADWAGGVGGFGSSDANVGGHNGPFGALNGYGHFVGDIALINVYNEALDANAVSALFQTHAPIPEPATAALSLLALSALGRRRRRAA